MAQLQFAFWDGVGGYAEQDENMADVYDEHIRLAQRLEELGWHSYFVIEHQNSPVGRITAPTVFLTAIARHQQAPPWRHDVAVALLSPAASGPGSGHARPPVARPGGVRDGYRRA